MSLRPNIDSNVVQHTQRRTAYTVVIDGSRKGSDLLISQGYSYNRGGKVKKKGEQRWKCTIRDKTTNCLASVIQHGDVFKRGKRLRSSKCKHKVIGIRYYTSKKGSPASPTTRGTSCVYTNHAITCAYHQPIETVKETCTANQS